MQKLLQHLKTKYLQIESYLERLESMIKKLAQDADPSDMAKAPKQLDGLQFDAGDDEDSFYQGTGKSAAPAPAAPQPTPVVTPAAPKSMPVQVNAQSAVPAAQSLSSAAPAMTASTQYAPVNLGTSSNQAAIDAIPNSDRNIIERKMLLEEAKFELDREKSRHAMKMELMKEQFRQDQLNAEEEKSNKKESEHWMKAYWRPVMGWLYMAINLFDFVVAPLLQMAMPLLLKGTVTTVTYQQWQSLTLQNGGLIHLAFGAILGVTAWTRGQEKIAKMG